MTRIESKKNLQTVIEYNLKKKSDNAIFDKFWYQSRAKNFIQDHFSLRKDLHKIEKEKPQVMILSNEARHNKACASNVGEISPSLDASNAYNCEKISTQVEKEVRFGFEAEPETNKTYKIF